MRFLTRTALGAAAAYFLDPEQGAQRREGVRRRASALLGDRGRRAAGAAQSAAGQAFGAAQKAAETARGGGAPPSDQELKAKVETEMFRDSGAPKGGVVIDVVGGIVTLRGEVPDRGQISELEQAARAIEGVEGVENLLHTPSAPARKVKGASAAGRGKKKTP